MKKIVLLLLLIIISCNSSPNKNEKLLKALSNSAIVMRGTIVKIPNSELRLDYYDAYEKDSDVKVLERMNYQSGGYSWEGIIYGAITLSDESLLDKVRFDSEADGLAIWSNDEEVLKEIGRLISVIKTDKEVLKQCIKTAEENWKME